MYIAIIAVYPAENGGSGASGHLSIHLAGRLLVVLR